MTIQPDLIAEAKRIITAAGERNILLRLMGGVAIRIHSPSAEHRALVRRYPDLDFGIAGKRSNQTETLLAALDEVPKSFKWKARNKIGERMRWYELPEEVQRG